MSKKQTRIKLIIIPAVFALAFIFAPEAKAATYYISPSGTASWLNCTVSSNPCSLATANTNAKAGDTINLLSGNYATSIRPANSGSENNYITYKGNGTVRIAGNQATTDRNGTMRGCSLIIEGVSGTPKKYIKIMDIDFIRPAHSSPRWFTIKEASNIWLENCDFIEGGNRWAYSMSEIYNVKNSVLKNCFWDASNQTDSDITKQYTNEADCTSKGYWWTNKTVGGTTEYTCSGWQNDLFSVAGDSDSNLFLDCSWGNVSHNSIYFNTHEADFNIFKNNKFTNKWRHGITMRKGPNMIEGSYFEDIGRECEKTPYFYDRCDNGRIPGTIYSHSPEYSIYRYNIVTRSTSGISYRNVYGETHNNYFYHNDIYNNDNSGGKCVSNYCGHLLMSENSTTDVVNNNKQLNNIFYEGTAIYHYSTYNFQYPDILPANNIIAYNILGSSGGERIRYGKTIGNLAYLESTNSQWITGTNSNKDPMLNSDFTLRSGSPAIDKGGFLATVKSVSGNKLFLNANEEYAFFSAEKWNHQWHGLLASDEIFSNKGSRTKITGIDYIDHSLIVNSVSGFSPGDKITTVNFSGSAPDIGAHEYIGSIPTYITGDLNKDGKVGIADYSMFIQDFGKTGTNLPADLNKNGQVEIGDYSIFISNFGKTT